MDDRWLSNQNVDLISKLHPNRSSENDHKIQSFSGRLNGFIERLFCNFSDYLKLRCRQKFSVFTNLSLDLTDILPSNCVATPPQLPPPKIIYQDASTFHLIAKVFLCCKPICY